MKTIQQLLQLSRNPFYKFSPEEKAVLDNFLLSPVDSPMTTSQKKRLKKSLQQTRVVVRNVVEKTATYPTEAHQSLSDER